MEIGAKGTTGHLACDSPLAGDLGYGAPGLRTSSVPACSTTAKAEASFRRTIIRNMVGACTYHPGGVELQQRGQPSIARAPTLFLGEINATPLSLPGDSRLMNCQLVGRQFGCDRFS